MAKLSEKNKDFFEMVYQVVKLIPKGRVTSYGAIARYLGQSRGARMVGWAMNNAHQQPDDIPAHRVVNRQGLLTGKFHFETLDTMQNLLEKEGVEVVDDKIRNFEKLYWDPVKEIEMDEGSSPL